MATHQFASYLATSPRRRPHRDRMTGIVSYIVRTHVEAKDDGSEIDYMYDLTDLIIDALDSADFDMHSTLSNRHRYLRA